MRIFLFTLLFTFSINAFSQDINWISWEEMVQLQQQERKKVFVDVYTDWCGWCKKMDASTFIDPSVVNTMNQYYYAVKLDAEMKDTIKYNEMMFVNLNPEDKRGVHTLAVSLLNSKMSYPSFVILDENFNRNIIISGYQQVPEMLGNLLFFGTNQHVRLNEYEKQQQKALQAAQEQAEKGNTPAPMAPTGKNKKVNTQPPARK